MEDGGEVENFAETATGTESGKSSKAKRKSKSSRFSKKSRKKNKDKLENAEQSDVSNIQVEPSVNLDVQGDGAVDIKGSDRTDDVVKEQGVPTSNSEIVNENKETKTSRVKRRKGDESESRKSRSRSGSRSRLSGFFKRKKKSKSETDLHEKSKQESSSADRGDSAVYLSTEAEVSDLSLSKENKNESESVRRSRTPRGASSSPAKTSLRKSSPHHSFDSRLQPRKRLLNMTVRDAVKEHRVRRAGSLPRSTVRRRVEEMSQSQNASFVELNIPRSSPDRRSGSDLYYSDSKKRSTLPKSKKSGSSYQDNNMDGSASKYPSQPDLGVHQNSKDEPPRAMSVNDEGTLVVKRPGDILTQEVEAVIEVLPSPNSNESGRDSEDTATLVDVSLISQEENAPSIQFLSQQDKANRLAASAEDVQAKRKESLSKFLELRQNVPSSFNRDRRLSATSESGAPIKDVSSKSKDTRASKQLSNIVSDIVSLSSPETHSSQLSPEQNSLPTTSDIHLPQKASAPSFMPTVSDATPAGFKPSAPRLSLNGTELLSSDVAALTEKPRGPLSIKGDDKESQEGSSSMSSSPKIPSMTSSFPSSDQGYVDGDSNLSDDLDEDDDNSAFSTPPEDLYQTSPTQNQLGKRTLVTPSIIEKLLKEAQNQDMNSVPHYSDAVDTDWYGRSGSTLPLKKPRFHIDDNSDRVDSQMKYVPRGVRRSKSDVDRRKYTPNVVIRNFSDHLEGRTAEVGLGQGQEDDRISLTSTGTLTNTEDVVASLGEGGFRSDKTGEVLKYVPVMGTTAQQKYRRMYSPIRARKQILLASDGHSQLTQPSSDSLLPPTTDIPLATSPSQTHSYAASLNEEATKITNDPKIESPNLRAEATENMTNRDHEKAHPLGMAMFHGLELSPHKMSKSSSHSLTGLLQEQSLVTREKPDSKREREKPKRTKSKRMYRPDDKENKDDQEKSGAISQEDSKFKIMVDQSCQTSIWLLDSFVKEKSSRRSPKSKKKLQLFNNKKKKKQSLVSEMVIPTEPARENEALLRSHDDKTTIEDIPPTTTTATLTPVATTMPLATPAKTSKQTISSTIHEIAKPIPSEPSSPKSPIDGDIWVDAVSELPPSLATRRNAMSGSTQKHSAFFAIRPKHKPLLETGFPSPLYSPIKKQQSMKKASPSSGYTFTPIGDEIKPEGSKKGAHPEQGSSSQTDASGSDKVETAGLPKNKKLSFMSIFILKNRIARFREKRQKDKNKSTQPEDDLIETDLPSDTFVTIENELNLSKLEASKETDIIDEDVFEPEFSLDYNKRTIRFEPIAPSEPMQSEEPLPPLPPSSSRRHRHRRESTMRERRRKCVQYIKKFIAFLFSHVGLCSLVVAYTIMGGFIFQALEDDSELEVRKLVVDKREQVIGQLRSLALSVRRNERGIDNITGEFNRTLVDFQAFVHEATKEYGWDGYEGDEEEGPWSFASSLLYAITVTTTIGYGHVAPKSPEGRIVTIGYAVVGIPLTLLCLTNIGDVMATGFRLLYGKVCCGVCCTLFKRRRRRLPIDLEKGLGRPIVTTEEEQPDKPKEVIHVPTSLCLLLIASYIFAGAMLFSVWEDWDMLTGSYFCFITLSTIGFGDIVPGMDSTAWAGEEKLVLCALYLVLGLSLIAMCFNLVQEDVKAKCRWLGMKLGIVEKPETPI